MFHNQPYRTVGVFESQKHAVDAVNALRGAGISSEHILLAARQWEDRRLDTVRVDLQQSASKGAVAGSVWGTGIGAVLGVAVGLLPGIGVSALILGALGAATGAAGGAFAGPFIAMDMTEEDADAYGKHIAQERTLVIVHTPTEELTERVQSILNANGAYDFSMTSNG